LADSHANVLISEDFRSALDAWGIEVPSHVIHNWAPLDQLRPQPKDNPWSREHGLADKFVFLYTGSLGLKHDPSLLLRLAQSLRHEANVVVVVVSEGLGANHLRERGADLPTLRVMNYQPFETMEHVLATADVLTVILEPEAGLFSVPSKTLSYLCAQRPIVGAIPTENLAARILRDHQAGLVSPANDSARFIENARRLLGDPELRAALGCNGRDYADRHFAIEPIAERFERVIATARDASRAGQRANRASAPG
jgi:glycosyltransferase involved in cell wall biosynthesis